jgi:methylmalonyl-CoA/ethylmalonyl-CoA epimerase
MISRIDHVAIAVRDFKKASDFFCSVLGATPCTWAVNDAMKYLGQVFSLGDLSRIELLNPTEKGSFLDNFLDKHEGIHHICLETPDIGKAKESLERLDIPYFGYYEYPHGRWKELFVHPKHAFGVLIQIAEFYPDDFIVESLRVAGGARWSVEKDDKGVTMILAHPGGGTARIEMTAEEVRALAGDLLATLE